MDAETPTVEIDADDACDEELCPEAFAVKTKKAPELPTQAEVAAHDVVHCPYRSWCEICVAASGREDAHSRSNGCDVETGLPILSLDYELLEGPVTVLVCKLRPSGAALAYSCTAKGPSDTWVVRQIVRDLEDYGIKDVCLKTDGEPAILALQEAIAKARNPRTIPRNPPAYNPQSNGAAEKAVQDVAGQLRRLTLALEARLHQRVSTKLPIMAWLVRHAAFVLTHFQVGHDGLTPWRRMTGRHWSGMVAEFGEQVMGKLAKKQPGSTKKQKRGKTKLTARSIHGTYVGIWPRTGEHLLAVHNGEVIRVRTIHRLTADKQWDADAVLAVRATPRNPGPQREPEPRLEGDKEEETPEVVNVKRPEHQDAHGPARELKIDARLLAKYGLTDECAGCVHHQLGLGTRRAHSSACRQRIYELMKDDPMEVDRLIAADERLRRAQPKEELARRAKQDFPMDPREVDHRPSAPKNPRGAPDAFLCRAAALRRSLSLEEEMTRTWAMQTRKSTQAFRKCPREAMTRLQTVQCQAFRKCPREAMTRLQTVQYQTTVRVTLMKRWPPLKPLQMIERTQSQEEQKEL